MISGFSESAIEVAYNDEEDVKQQVGIMGEASFTENANISGKITFRLKQTSPSNSFLDILRKSKVAFPVLFTNRSGNPFTAACDIARIGNRPKASYEAEEKEREWIISCGQLITAEA
jgi:hypothetical protein